MCSLRWANEKQCVFLCVGFKKKHAYHHNLSSYFIHIHIIIFTLLHTGRLTGPYLGSLVFAWSETNGQLWPFNYFLVWYLLAILAVINARVSYLLPRSIERRRREPREPRYASLASTGNNYCNRDYNHHNTYTHTTTHHIDILLLIESISFLI